MQRQPITDELISKICHDYFTLGKSLSYVHSKYDITYDKMRYILDQNGGVRKTKRIKNIEVYKQVYADFQCGTTDINYLSRKYSISNSTVYKILHSNGIWTDSNKPRIDRDKVWELYEKNKGVTEIAEAVGCSRNLVYRLVREYKAEHYGDAMQKSVDIQRQELYNSVMGGEEMAFIFKGKLQKNNTVTIPQPIQVALGLKCGDFVAFEIVPNGKNIVVQVKKDEGEEQ